MADGDPIRVLIVDDVAETRENIRKLLQFENDVEVVGAEGSGRAGVAAAKELRPDVVLMDINMPDMDGITATELIRRESQATQIVILSVQGDPNYMRRAMLAGARDFLTKPPAVDELTSTIRRAGEMSREEREKNPSLQFSGNHGKAAAPVAQSWGKIIMVYGPKGGTGATTVAVNLAVALQSDEQPVVLVDGNMQFGDVAVFLNEQVRNSVLDLTSRADELDAEFVEEVLIKHANSGVNILAAPPRPEFAENVIAEQFAKVLEYLRNFFAYIVIDASSTLTDTVIAAMDVSDIIVLLTVQDIPAIKNARLYLDLAQIMEIDRQKILFAMNRFDKKIGITPEKVGESFKHPVIGVIPYDERVVSSVNRGVPFMMDDRSRPISKSILDLGEIIQQRITELTAVDTEETVFSMRR